MGSESTATLTALLVFLLVTFIGVRYARILGDRATLRASYESVLNAYAPELRRTGPVRGPRVQVSILDRVGDRLIRPGYRRVLRKRLVSTGRQDMSSYRTLVRRKVMGLAIGLIYGGYIEFDGTMSGLFMTALFAVAGFVLPDVLTYNTGTKRAQQLDRSLADAIDILNLCVESGLTFQAAMAQAANILKGPISEEFSRVLRQMQLGQPMIQSMQDMAARNKNQDLDRFITVIVQSEKLGIPISAVLAEQAKEMRGKRREKARERAQKVPVKILMPVMLCFLPGIFIVVLGPAIISIMSAFSG
jgi:tight adherence protein C